MKNNLNLFYLIILIASCSSNNNIDKSEDNCNEIFDGDIELKTQSDVENFAVNNYSEVTGELLLSGIGVTVNPIIDVSSFSCLKKVGGLNISALNYLTNIDGLNNLIEIESNLIISYCSSLTSIRGLESLTIIGGNFFISSSESLLDITGVENLSSISRSIIIEDTSLENLRPLSGVNDTVGGLIFRDNNHLINLDGLNNIKILTGNLFISNNDVLKDISALNNLTSVSRGIDVWSNPQLININALENISSVVGKIDIHDNNSLETINFRNVSSVIGINFESYGYIKITDNPVLTSLGSWDNLTEVNNYLGIWNNTSLTDFCGLQTLLLSDGLTNLDELVTSYNVWGNSYNPTEENIINGNCSQ